MEVKGGYKKTEVGIIPKEWDVLNLRQCLRSAPTYGIGAAAIPFDYRFPTYIRITDITDDGLFIEDAKTSVNHPQAMSYMLEAGDIVVARTGASVGKSYLYNSQDGQLVFAGFLIRLQTNPDRLKPSFLWFFMQSHAYWNWVRINSMRSGQPGINGQEYASLLVPLPPKSEQNTITQALEDVKDLIESLQQLINKKLDLKKGAMQKLLTGKKRLPSFSGKWKEKLLADLFNFSGGFSASRDQLSGEGYCYLHYGDIHMSQKSFVDVRSEFQEIPKLNISLKRISPDSLLNDGDIVFVDASEDDEGTSKYVVVVNPEKIPFISGLHTIVAKSKTDELDKRYLRYCFQTEDIKRQFYFYAVGTKVSGISKANIARITIPVPSVTEQAAIALILSDMDAELAALEVKLGKARQIKQGMMQELLTGKIRLVG